MYLNSTLNSWCDLLSMPSVLTLWGCVTHIWLVACSAPSHYLNQCCNILNWTLENKLQWKFNQNSSIFIEKNSFENVICEMALFCLGLNVLIIKSPLCHYTTLKKIAKECIPACFHAVGLAMFSSAPSHLLGLPRVHIWPSIHVLTASVTQPFVLAQAREDAQLIEDSYCSH